MWRFCGKNVKWQTWLLRFVCISVDRHLQKPNIPLKLYLCLNNLLETIDNFLTIQRREQSTQNSWSEVWSTTSTSFQAWSCSSTWTTSTSATSVLLGSSYLPTPVLLESACLSSLAGSSFRKGPIWMTRASPFWICKIQALQRQVLKRNQSNIYF